MESSFNEHADDFDSTDASENVETPNVLQPALPEDPTDVDVAYPVESPTIAHPAIPLNEFLPIAPQQVTLDRLIGLIVSAVVVIGGIVGLVIYFFSISNLDWIFWLIVGASALAMLFVAVMSFLWPPIEVRNTSWRLESRGLEIRRGVFWKHQISIPSSRVQHIDVSQGPLQRNFGLATLTIHTAGTANASVELAGLDFDTASSLRDRLMEQREALNVV